MLASQAQRGARRYGPLLALFSVVGGVIQLLFLRWADTNLPRGPRLAVGVPMFLVYIAVVAVLSLRMRQRARSRM